MRDTFKNKISIFLVGLAAIGLGAAAQANPRPLQGSGLLVFESESSGICAGYGPGGARTLIADRCENLKDDRLVQLSFGGDYTIRSVQTGECLTRHFPVAIYKDLTFQPCRYNADLQRFASVMRVLGNGVQWRMLVPLEGPADTFEPMPGTCLATGWPHPALGRFAGVYVWSCADWEYSPNKAISSPAPAIGGLGVFGVMGVMGSGFTELGDLVD